MITEAEVKEFLEAINNITSYTDIDLDDEDEAEVTITKSKKATWVRGTSYRRRQHKRHTKRKVHHNTYYLFEGDRGKTVNKPYLRCWCGHRSNVTGYYKAYSNRRVRRNGSDNISEDAIVYNHGKYKRLFDYGWTVDCD